MLHIPFASHSELYAANTTINVVSFPKTGRKCERAKKNIKNIQRSM
jgi:hypothetical protein